MKLKEKINDDLKSAMKAGDKVKLETIRSLRALILEHEKSGKEKELSVEDEIKLLTSAAKKRSEAIEQYEKAGRNDLAEKEQRELDFIKEYLPEQMTEDELFNAVKELAEELGANSKADFPKLMPAAISKFKGKAGGKEIKGAVEKVLS